MEESVKFVSFLISDSLKDDNNEHFWQPLTEAQVVTFLTLYSLMI